MNEYIKAQVENMISLPSHFLCALDKHHQDGKSRPEPEERSEENKEFNPAYRVDDISKQPRAGMKHRNHSILLRKNSSAEQKPRAILPHQCAVRRALRRNRKPNAAKDAPAKVVVRGLLVIIAHADVTAVVMIVLAPESRVAAVVATS